MNPDYRRAEMRVPLGVVSGVHGRMELTVHARANGDVLLEMKMTDLFARYITTVTLNEVGMADLKAAIETIQGMIAEKREGLTAQAHVVPAMSGSIGAVVKRILGKTIFLVAFLVPAIGCTQQPSTPPAAVSPSLSRDDVREIVTETVQAELQKRDAQIAEARATIEKEAEKLELKEAAERFLRMTEEAKAAQLRSLTDDEKDRVNRIREGLLGSGIWSMSPDDLQFATYGRANLVLREVCLKAAEIDGPDHLAGHRLSKLLKWTPEQKLDFALEAGFARRNRVQMLATVLSQGGELDSDDLAAAANEDCLRPLIEKYQQRATSKP